MKGLAWESRPIYGVLVASTSDSEVTGVHNEMIFYEYDIQGQMGPTFF